MNKVALESRKRELGEEIKKAMTAHEEGRLAANRFKGIVDKAYVEAEEIQNTLKALEWGQQMLGAQDVALQQLCLNDWGNGAPSTKAFSAGGVPVPHDLARMGATGWAQSLAGPASLSRADWQKLYAAAEQGSPVRVTAPVTKSWGPAGHVFTKSTTPVTESGSISSTFTGTLPPLVTPYAVGMAYDPLVISSLFPSVMMPGPSAQQFVHSSNAAEAAITPEATAKPNLQPGFTGNQIIPSKFAVLVYYTLEAQQDTSQYGEAAFDRFLPYEAQASWQNSINDALINAVSGTNNATFNGLLHTSGALSQAVGMDYPLDALNKAFVAVRNGSAFADPDLVLMSPNTLGALRRLRDSSGRYIMDLLAGPLHLSAYGQPAAAEPAEKAAPYFRIPQGQQPFSGSLWGAEIAVSTHVPDGTAAVLSVKAGGGLVWIRQALEGFYNPGYGDTAFSENLMAWRFESRLSFNVPRPSALCICTGLPVS